jgi:hypothetical protein
MKEKEDFAKLTSAVYNKNENIDYDKKMQRIRLMESRLREIDEFGTVVSQEA